MKTLTSAVIISIVAILSFNVMQWLEQKLIKVLY